MKAVFENKDIQMWIKQVSGFWAFPPMFHAHMEIVYVVEGSVTMQIDGKHHVLQKDQLSICFPYVIHSYEEAPDAQAIILLFSPDSVGTLSWNPQKTKPSMPFLTPGPEILPLLQRMLHYAKNRDTGAEMLGKAYLTALMGELLMQQSMEAIKDVDRNVITEVLSYCAEHFAEDISITAVARSLHISESYVTKLFNTKLNSSFRNYVNQLRIMEAKKLLRSTSRSIVDIMLSCGFNNQSSFNRVFSQETGMTPRQFRQKADSR